MGIVGCYELHLYCDNTLPSATNPVAGQSHRFDEFPWCSSADCQTYGEAKKEAQARGWLFRRDGTVICPRCAQANHG